MTSSPATGQAAAAQEDPTGLSDDEMAAAERAGMSPERYAALKGVVTLEDWQRLAQGGEAA